MTFLSQHGDAAKERQQQAEVRRQEQQLRADEARRLREEQDGEMAAENAESPPKSHKNDVNS